MGYSDKPSPIELLLNHCLVSGETSFSESGTTINVKPEIGETILFFSIDDQSNYKCGLRELFWGTQESENICDLIVFYANKDGKRVFCFVELKANISDLKKATKQVINTYNAFKKHLKLQNVYKFKAFICASRGSVPQEHQQCNNELAKVFQKDNFKSNGTGKEFGDFLREKQPKGRRRKKSRSRAR